MRNTNQPERKAADLASEAIFSQIKPTYTSYDDVQVKISTKSAVMQDFFNAFVSSVEIVITAEGSTSPVSEAEILAYLQASVYARVAQVSGLQYKDWVYRDSFRIPSFLAVCLAQIGEVERSDLGLMLKPVWGDSEVPTIDRATLNKVSMFLGTLEKRGFEMVNGLPRDRKGSVPMMSLQVVENHVLSTTPEYHPSYAVIAGFFGITGLATVLGSKAFRVNYGSLTQFKNLAYEVVGPKRL